MTNNLQEINEIMTTSGYPEGESLQQAPHKKDHVHMCECQGLDEREMAKPSLGSCYLHLPGHRTALAS